MLEDNREKNECFTGERFISIIMDYIAPDCIWPDSLKLKLLKDGFVSSSERFIQVCLRTYIECRFTVLNN